MIKIEKVEITGWKYVIMGMRNLMNSWSESDSFCIPCVHCDKEQLAIAEICGGFFYYIGKKDHELMMKLEAGDSVHAKYRRMLEVYLDITAPLYWWKEFDAYEVGIVSNSCSTMHKIVKKEFEWSDFSTEHLTNFGMWGEQFTEADAAYAPAKTMRCVISALNGARERYLDYKSRGKDWEIQAKMAWWQIIQLLPSSYNQRRTVMLNYEVLAGIYPMRKNHKLDEWREFCQWIESLPYSEIIIGGEEMGAN